jgi:hypothetical protein
MFFRPLVRKFALFCGLLCFCLTLLAGFPAHSLSTEEVDALASQVTVLIARGLKKGDLEEKREWNPGSGVIISRQGRTYYAITNNHVVKEPSDGNDWGVRTADGEVHVITDTGNNILRLGRYLSNEEPIEGFDLALVKFTSNKDYLVAVMGNSETLQANDHVFVSGWPRPEIEEARRIRVFRSGQVTKIVPAPHANGGYSILYSNQTAPGMSGGPVFNAAGELVGIHGQGRAKGNIYCVDPAISPNNSCGIQTVHFISAAEAQQIKLIYTPPPVQAEAIARGRRNKKEADVIKNIFELFSQLDVRTRDCPLGGFYDVEGCEQ